ncbi:hypothetical protein [Nocardioides dubius]
MPDDVVARLDDTLAELVSSRSAEAELPAADGPEVTAESETDESNVTQLRPRRRRNALLAAAAAVIVIGAGGSYVAQLGSSSGDGSNATPASSAEAEVSESSDSLSDQGSSSEFAPEQDLADGRGNSAGLSGELKLDSLRSTLSYLEPPLTKREQRQVERAVAEALPAGSDSEGYSGSANRLQLKKMTASSCAALKNEPTPARADVTYYLVRQTSDTPRVIDIVTCEKGEERPLTSVTLAPRE